MSNLEIYLEATIKQIKEAMRFDLDFAIQLCDSALQEIEMQRKQEHKLRDGQKENATTL